MRARKTPKADPKKGKAQQSVQIPRELKAELDQLADQSGFSTSFLMRRCVEKALPLIRVEIMESQEPFGGGEKGGGEGGKATHETLIRRETKRRRTGTD